MSLNHLVKYLFIVFLFILELSCLKQNSSVIETWEKWTPETPDTTIPESALILPPVADATVRNGIFNERNLGREEFLVVRLSPESNSTQQSYLKFDLKEVKGTIHSVRLRLYGKLTTEGFVNALVRGVPDPNWNESSITWNNKPLAANDLSRIQLRTTTPQWYEVDVTPYVRKEKRDGRNVVSFALHSVINDSMEAVFNSRENTENCPVLVVTTATALMVTGSAALSEADEAIRKRLEALGYLVTIKESVKVATADAIGKSLVLISSSANEKEVNVKFRDVSVPVLIWKSTLFDDMLMTGPAEGTDYGESLSQTQLAIADKYHHLAAGCTGIFQGCTTPTALSWGKPSQSAVIIATLASAPAKAAIFGYVRGAEMLGMKAPARRVGIFLGEETARFLSYNGWKLFDTAVQWAAGARPFVEKKLFVINFDPILEGYGNLRLTQFFKKYWEYSGWTSAHTLVAQFVYDIGHDSGDYVRWKVVAIQDVDEWPLFIDGYRYTDKTYVEGYLYALNNDWNDSRMHNNVEIDYSYIIKKYNLDARISNGEFDEVFIAAPPYHCFSESRMLGPKPYFVNGPAMVTRASRHYIIHYIDISRPVPLFEEGYFHRIEWIMRTVYGNLYGSQPSAPFGNWNTCPYDYPEIWITSPKPHSATIKHLWDRWTLVDGVAATIRNLANTKVFAGVGTIHFMPTAQSFSADNYNWGFPSRPMPDVLSTADDWLFNYPHLTGETRLIGCDEWMIESGDDPHEHGAFRWLCNHIPRIGGRYADGALNNWWEYIVNYDDYPESNHTE